MKKILTAIAICIPLILVGVVIYWKYYPSSSLGRSGPPNVSLPSSLVGLTHDADIMKKIEEAPGDYILGPDFHAAFMNDLNERSLGDEEAVRSTGELQRYAPLVLLHLAIAYASGDCTELSEMLIGLGDRSGSLVCSRLERHRRNAISHRFVKSDTPNNLLTFTPSVDTAERDLPMHGGSNP
jgi:hypothetical protein